MTNQRFYVTQTESGNFAVMDSVPMPGYLNPVVRMSTNDKASAERQAEKYNAAGEKWYMAH